MSQENVEVVRAFYEAWNTGVMEDFGGMYDPDDVVEPISGCEVKARR